MTQPMAFVIEDDVNLADAFAEAVRAAGYQAENIYDGKTAKTRLMESPPALVILDLHIPLITREDEIIKLINADERLVHTRVVITTADSVSAEALRENASLVLLKPIGFGQLKTLAERLRPAEPK